MDSQKAAVSASRPLIKSTNLRVKTTVSHHERVSQQEASSIKAETPACGCQDQPCKGRSPARQGGQQGGEKINLFVETIASQIDGLWRSAVFQYDTERDWTARRRNAETIAFRSDFVDNLLFEYVDKTSKVRKTTVATIGRPINERFRVLGDTAFLGEIKGDRDDQRSERAFVASRSETALQDIEESLEDGAMRDTTTARGVPLFLVDPAGRRQMPVEPHAIFHTSPPETLQNWMGCCSITIAFVGTNYRPIICLTVILKNGECAVEMSIHVDQI